MKQREKRPFLVSANINERLVSTRFMKTQSFSTKKLPELPQGSQRTPKKAAETSNERQLKSDTATGNPNGSLSLKESSWNESTQLTRFKVIRSALRSITPSTKINSIQPFSEPSLTSNAASSSFRTKTPREENIRRTNDDYFVRKSKAHIDKFNDILNCQCRTERSISSISIEVFQAPVEFQLPKSFFDSKRGFLSKKENKQGNFSSLFFPKNARTQSERDLLKKNDEIFNGKCKKMNFQMKINGKEEKSTAKKQQDPPKDQKEEGLRSDQVEKSPLILPKNGRDHANNMAFSCKESHFCLNRFGGNQNAFQLERKSQKNEGASSFMRNDQNSGSAKKKQNQKEEAITALSVEGIKEAIDLRKQMPIADVVDSMFEKSEHPEGRKTQRYLSQLVKIYGIKQVDAEGNPKTKKFIEFDQEIFQDLFKWLIKTERNLGLILKTSKAIPKQQVPSPKYTMDFSEELKKTLAISEVNLIKEEFFKGENERDYEVLDSLCKKLRYFEFLPQRVRLMILKKGLFLTYQPGTIIFNEGDFGDRMYIILKGSCTVYNERGNKNAENARQVVASLYDGSLFGELAMMGTTRVKRKQEHKLLRHVKAQEANEEEEEMSSMKHKKGKKVVKQLGVKLVNEEEGNPSAIKQRYYQRTRRAAGVMASETSHLLSLTRDQFQEILSDFLQTELDKKLRVLKNVSFLKSLDPFVMIPLASNMSEETFRMGECIVGEGAVNEKFYVVASGRCRVVKEMVMSRTQEVMKHSKISKIERKHKEKEKYEMLKQYQSEEMTKQIELAKKDFQRKSNHLRAYEDARPNTRTTFHSERILQEGQFLIYKEHIPLNTLRKGDFFGTKALRTPLTVSLLPSRVSVVADAPDTRVYSLERSRTEYIPMKLLLVLFNSTEKLKDFDEADDFQEKISRHLEWLKMKDSFVRELVANQKTT